MTSLKPLSLFLARNVEGYLFADLLTLMTASPPKGMSDGGANYPLLMTAFAGIELLGSLVTDGPFNATKGADHFNLFWRNYLYLGNADRQDAGAILYQLARNGLAHVFVVKGPLHVLKSSPNLHLTKTESGIVSVDAVQLAIDLRAAYESRIKPALVAATPLAETMAARLLKVESAYSKESRSAIANLRLPFPPAVNVDPSALTTSPGATGPAFPIS